MKIVKNNLKYVLITYEKNFWNVDNYFHITHSNKLALKSIYAFLNLFQ